MNKLDEILKLKWTVEIAIGHGGVYYVEARSWEHLPILIDGYTLSNAIDKLYKIIIGEK